MTLFTPEEELLGKTVSDFAARELLPHAGRIDEEEGFNAAAFKHMADLGLLGVTVSDEYGGAGLGTTASTLVMEAMARVCASTTLSYLAHSILCVNNLFENASDAQKRKYLPNLISGKLLGGMGMTEPGAGSDALALRTKATRERNHYILEGTKTFITNGPVADVFVIYARTGTEKKDISTFIIEKNTEGFKVGKKLHKLGMRGSPTSELIFDRCLVPIENLVGRENDSVSHMMRNLNVERITISGISLGIARATLDYSIRYAKERSQFGKPISEFQMIQEKVAEMSTELEAGRALTYAAARAYDQGAREMTLGARAKLFTAKMATRIALEGIQILGGYGYIKEYPVERYLRDAKLMEIGAGTNEVMRLIIAKQLLDG